MNLHFVAIGGSAMHSLAIAMHRLGHKVSGSDDVIFEPSKSNLRNTGLLPPRLGWFPKKIDSEIDIVIFLRDPLIKQGHHEDIQKLLEACNMYNIPLATNYASAELMILGQIKKEDYERRKSMNE